MTNVSNPRVHADLIKKWADGAQIQVLDSVKKEWCDVHNNVPLWHPDVEYRVKPEITTSLSDNDLWDVFCEDADPVPAAERLRMVADAAIRQYIKEQELK